MRFKTRISSILITLFLCVSVMLIQTVFAQEGKLTQDADNP